MITREKIIEVNKINAFDDFIKIAKNGEILVLSRVLSCNNWCCHPKGALIKNNKSFSINGCIPSTQEEWNIYYYNYKEKRAINEKNDQFFTNNGKTFIYQGDWDDWDSYLDNLVIQKDGQLLLNGKILIYKGEFAGWALHPNGEGIIIAQKGKLLFYAYKFYKN